jgi:hypothetical protein
VTFFIVRVANGGDAPDSGRRVSLNPCLKADISSTGSAPQLNADDGTKQRAGGGDDHGAFRGFVANRL